MNYNYMIGMKVTGRIHSLNGEVDTVTVVDYKDINHVIVNYNGKKYTAVHNEFLGFYAVDDIYGLVEE